MGARRTTGCHLGPEKDGPIAVDDALLADTSRLFRSLNGRIRELAGAKGDDAHAFVCECLNERCFGTLMLTAAEFDALRDEPDTFVVRTGHEDGDAEDVIGRSDGHTLVIRAAGTADQYEMLKDKGMSKERAAGISDSPGSSSRGGKNSHSGSSRSSSSQGGTSAQKRAAGRKGGKATAREKT